LKKRNPTCNPFNAFQSLLGIGAATEPTTYAMLYNAERSQNQPGSSSIGN
jgi:hypothetical protein